MITQPSDIKQKDTWNGRSKDGNTGSTNPNLESSMSFVEHQRIVLKAGGLLESMNYPDDEQKANKAKAALTALKGLFDGSEDGVLYISKGIHQPYGNPHIQLTAEIGGVDYLYHLEVSAHQVVTDNAGKEHFHWTGACFTARLKNDKPSWEAEQYDMACWPVSAPITPKRNKDRRNSISAPGLLKLNQAIDEEKARRQAESDAQLRRNAVLATVEQKLSLTPKDKTQLKKLWGGEAAVFVTKTKKDVRCTFDGTYFEQSGQKLKV